ncbi:porphobilinogen deaminase [Oceaniovalibus guishaninsula JLT2003]|uniref:Porphobilinogen deaminase n=1 Tax=Oceaniovalibus guishaninsula JLT2003 TaxID=1231392 RepID=K2HDW2_9RHOB|nr:hydroxymethylbilane synthase [Oceaniovalibus guishaninsula]EKE44722.1 porphobilinogen deaminase [Oceaniovalibus guishaninsula JLT2003]
MDMPDPQSPLKIGTRGSPLALAQANETRARLADAFRLPGEAFTIVVIKTTGDRVIDRPLKEIGGKGLFTREIEEALLSGGIDIAVHSMKDMPVDQPDGLLLDTYLPREDVRDAFISVNGDAGLDALAEGAVVGTSSLRRKAQLLHRRPDLDVVEFRGNVQTRMRKLEDGVAGATFLAMAGLNRLGMDIPRSAIPPETMLPAIAQGAIGIERRADDIRVAGMLEAIHDAATGQRLAAERAFLAALDGSCETPIAGLADLDGKSLTLRGEILRTDGSESLSDVIDGPVEDGADMGRALAERLLARAGPGFFDWRD